MVTRTCLIRVRLPVVSRCVTIPSIYWVIPILRVAVFHDLVRHHYKEGKVSGKEFYFGNGLLLCLFGLQ